MTDVELTRIMSKPAVSKSLPVSFKNGFTVCDFSVTCGKCSKEVTTNNIKGDVLQMNDSCTSFNGHALCYDCQTVTPVECRFRDDGTYLIKDGAGWRQEWISVKFPSLISLMQHILKNLFNHFWRR